MTSKCRLNWKVETVYCKAKGTQGGPLYFPKICCFCILCDVLFESILPTPSSLIYTTSCQPLASRPILRKVGS